MPTMAGCSLACLSACADGGRAHLSYRRWPGPDEQLETGELWADRIVRGQRTNHQFDANACRCSTPRCCEDRRWDACKKLTPAPNWQPGDVCGFIGSLLCSARDLLGRATPHGSLARWRCGCGSPCCSPTLPRPRRRAQQGPGGQSARPEKPRRPKTGRATPHHAHRMTGEAR